MRAAREDYTGKGKFAGVAKALNALGRLLNSMQGENGIDVSCDGGTLRFTAAPKTKSTGDTRPVRLVCVNDEDTVEISGEDVPAIGDAENPPRLLYDVYKLTDDLEATPAPVAMLSSVDPVQAPHEFRRSSVGTAIPATFGYIHTVVPYAPDPEEPDAKVSIALGWINEIIDTEACI